MENDSVSVLKRKKDGRLLSILDASADPYEIYELARGQGPSRMIGGQAFGEILLHSRRLDGSFASVTCYFVEG